MKYRPFILLFLALFLASCSFSLAEDITPPPGARQSPATQVQAERISGPLYPLMPPNPENGAPIYAEKCAPCHGDSGLGDGPQATDLPNPVAPLGSPDLARQAAPVHWYNQVTQGNLERFMPPFNSLSDRQRWDVVAYAYTLSTSEETLNEGRELYQANCASCHGVQGKGDGPEAAGTKPTDFTDQALMAEKTAGQLFQVISQGAPPAMPAFGGSLSEEERWALAETLRQMTFAGPSGQVAEAGLPAASLEETPLVTEGGSTVQDAPAETRTAGTPVAEAAPVGEVRGQVVNGSGGSVGAGLEVTLHGFDQMQSVLTDTTKTQADGSYVFEDIELPAGRAFLVAVDYGEATYGSDVALVEDGMTGVELPVTVYETTTDSSILTGDRLHLFFEFADEQTVRVIQLYILSNPTQQTLVAAEDGQPTLKFKLPEGAKNLQFQEGALGERYMETEDGFGDTVPIRPGEGSYQVLYAFELPYDRKLELVQPMSLPVNAVVVLVPEGGIKVQSDQLQDGGTRDVEGMPYHTYSGSGLAAGQDLRLTLTGRPGSASPTLGVGSRNDLLIGLGVFGLALVLAGAWLFQRTRASRAVDVDEEELSGEEEEEEQGDAETVMDAILTLDDRFKAGELPEDAYLQRRAELKAQLKALYDDPGQ